MKNLVLNEIFKILSRKVVLEKPKDKSLAHYASPEAFALAKELRKAPRLIAEELAVKFKDSEILSATAVNGYLNFHLKPAVLGALAENALRLGGDFAKNDAKLGDGILPASEKLCVGEPASKGSATNLAASGNDAAKSQNSDTQNFISQNSAEASNSVAVPKCDEARNSAAMPQKILLEYISANPTGPLHIGHVRGAVYGDTFARIGGYLGHCVDTEYYINDAGNQIELLGTSIALRARELAGEDVSYPEKYYRGEYIDEIIPLARAQFGDEIFRDESRVLILAEFAKDEVLKIIQKDLADAGIHIQNWASEKSLYGELEPTIKKLERSGKMYEQEGKIWIRSSQLGDEKDRVVIREDARPTYLAGDIVYHNNKFERGYEHCINIWGADHHGYIARLKAAVHFLGYDESRLEIILMQMVNLLKDGQTYKMSKRAGNAILMSDVLAAIGRDAMRFIFISKKGETPLEFDVDELAREDSSNPIFYINYAHARVNQIFTKAGKREADVLGADFGALDEAGLGLAFAALGLNEILNDAFNSRGLQKLPDFLKALAADFHKYYNENRVVGSENEDAKLKLFALVALSIRTAFALMGLSAKEKM
ncbi:arginine--tRNA ligase [uncultured Campylobacter sp.]|uniref:arginine--tRNA ligase n=1 Tax=uncultured Campylobacter sp. TaxID=218934 RepID=UPI0026234BBA|nr:arginine--tRNA ligase [uncultured Campylobacter sp.]